MIFYLDPSLSFTLGKYFFSLFSWDRFPWTLYIGIFVRFLFKMIFVYLPCYFDGSVIKCHMMLCVCHSAGTYTHTCNTLKTLDNHIDIILLPIK